MKYTFTNAEGRQQTVTIPDEDIARSKKAYGLSNKEAIDMWLSDEGYVVDPTVRELTEKAKANGATPTKSRKAPKRKEDPTKRALIASLFDFLMRDGVNLPMGRALDTVEVVNPERIISFTLGNDKYEITLSKKRK